MLLSVPVSLRDLPHEQRPVLARRPVEAQAGGQDEDRRPGSPRGVAETGGHLSGGELPEGQQGGGFYCKSYVGGLK